MYRLTHEPSTNGLIEALLAVQSILVIAVVLAVLFLVVSALLY